MSESPTASERIRAAREAIELPGWVSIVEVNLNSKRNAYRLVTSSPERERLERLCASMNDANRNPYLIFRALDYATAVKRFRS
jgi:hypothetical protein